MFLHRVPTLAPRRRKGTGRARAQARLPAYSGQPFRAVLREFGLSSNQVWGLAQTDEEWSTTLEAALTATRRDDLAQGTNAASVRGCVCSECQEY
jgi:hypothetical protein